MKIPGALQLRQRGIPYDRVFAGAVNLRMARLILSKAERLFTRVKANSVVL